MSLSTPCTNLQPEPVLTVFVVVIVVVEAVEVETADGQQNLGVVFEGIGTATVRMHLSALRLVHSL